ncbi:MAG: ABC transporter ATP-binding protein [Cyclobacteriaceae bacterium]
MNAFTIKNLECAYGDGKTVLSVPELDIPYGKICVFLGPSGVGKSTLLETLGLMNHTIKSGNVRFSDCSDDFNVLWDGGDIANVRNKYMSFIFQENNLLDNLTAIENAMIPLLIQGVEEQKAKSTIKEWCNSLALEFINDDTRVSELSVGQKQRLAFIRAASPDFTVLFGDEPTGNLDEKNGDVLMEALKSKIQSSASTMLSIIVSHDIDLALKYADEIIVLTKKGERVGTIDQKNIYKKNGTDWVSSGETMSSSTLRTFIAELL